MGIIDLFVAPVYLLLVLGILNFVANQRIKDPFLRKHYVLLFVAKFFGAIVFALIYQFFYGGGDTTNYYLNSTKIYEAFNYDALTGLKFVFAKAGDTTVDGGRFSQYMFFYRDAGSFFVARIGGFISFFCGNSYATISLFFSLISFTGVWAIYKVLINEFPYLKKRLVIGLLYLPSMIFWGSGYMKDPLCIGALGWLISGFYHIFLVRKRLFSSILLLLLGAFVLQQVKIYILLSVLPCLFIWALLYYQEKLKLGVLSIFIVPFFLAIGVFGGGYAASKLAEGDEKYSLDNIVETTAVTGHYLKRISKEGSKYSLSTTFDGSIGSLVRLAPEAIIVSFYRPFLWEARNPFMLLSALENFGLLILTIVGIFRYFSNRSKVPKKFRKEYFLSFCAVFCILFGVSIGVTTYNFGALVRYKIPMLPFLVSALFILNYNYSEYKKVIKKKLLFQKMLMIRGKNASSQLDISNPS